MKNTLGYRREKPEHHKPESDLPKPSVFVVGVPLLHHQAVSHVWQLKHLDSSRRDLG